MRQFFELLAWVLGILFLGSVYNAYQTQDYGPLFFVMTATLLVLSSIVSGAALGKVMVEVLLRLEFESAAPWRWRLAVVEEAERDKFCRHCRCLAFLSVLSTMGLSFYACFGLGSAAMTVLALFLGPVLPWALVLVLALAVAPFAGAGWLMNRLFLYLTACSNSGRRD